MREYIALKEFYSGDLDLYIQKGERIGYDGQKIMLRGDERKAPNFGAALRAPGFLQAATTDARGKPIDEAPVKDETPAERAVRLKNERIAKVYGGTGNGVPFDELKGQQVDKKLPRRDIELKMQTAKDAKAKLKTEKLAAEQAQDAKVVKKTAHQSKPKLEVVAESEGVEVGKVKQGGHVTEEEDPKTFYETMLEGGERKKLSVDKDSYIPAKRPVVVLSDQNEAIEVKRLVGADQVTPSGNPLKDWGKMTATKKHAFIKKNSDVEVLKKIINDETGETKRKAVARLTEVKS